MTTTLQLLQSLNSVDAQLSRRTPSALRPNALNTASIAGEEGVGTAQPAKPGKVQLERHLDSSGLQRGSSGPGTGSGLAVTIPGSALRRRLRRHRRRVGDRGLRHHGPSMREPPAHNTRRQHDRRGGGRQHPTPPRNRCRHAGSHRLEKLFVRRSIGRRGAGHGGGSHHGGGGHAGR